MCVASSAMTRLLSRPCHACSTLGPDDDQSTPLVVLWRCSPHVAFPERRDRSDVGRVDVVDRLMLGAVDDDVGAARAERPAAGADDGGVVAVAEDSEPRDPPHEVARHHDAFLLQVFGTEEDSAE